jgi:glutamyl-tRNA reductase
MDSADLPIAVLGVDHHDAPVALRERLAVAGVEATQLLTQLRSAAGVDEAVVLSTCNRLELHLAGAPDRDTVAAVLAGFRGIDPRQLEPVLRWRAGGDAARHLFRVAAGLESLVLGEDQIIRQVKDAYEAAHAAGATGTQLNTLFQRALASAKDVRTRTGLGRHKLSVASVAVDLAKHVLGDLGQTRLLVVGAGEMAELVLTYLRSAGIAAVTVTNRSHERAVALAAGIDGAVACPWADLAGSLATHDLVVTSTAAPRPVITAEAVRLAMRRRRRPLVVIDLAVPRDVEADAGHVDDVYLHNIDHLQHVVAGHRERRSEEIDAAEALIGTHLATWIAERTPGRDHALSRAAAWFDDVVATECARIAPKLSDASSRAAARDGMIRVAGKLRHRVMTVLKSGDPEAAAAIRRLLDVD